MFFFSNIVIGFAGLFLVALLVRNLYTGDPCEGVRSLPPQTCKKSLVRPWKLATSFPKRETNVQAPVVQRLNNAIHQINHHPANKYWKNKLHYPLDSDLSGG